MSFKSALPELWKRRAEDKAMEAHRPPRDLQAIQGLQFDPRGNERSLVQLFSVCYLQTFSKGIFIWSDNFSDSKLHQIPIKFSLNQVSCSYGLLRLFCFLLNHTIYLLFLSTLCVLEI